MGLAWRIKATPEGGIFLFKAAQLPLKRIDFIWLHGRVRFRFGKGVSAGREDSAWRVERVSLWDGSACCKCPPLLKSEVDIGTLSSIEVQPTVCC